jgi:electron transfer flavoprotein alpha subunit
MTRRFWVYIEQEEGRAHPVSWELLGEARQLAEQANAGQTDPEQKVVVEGVLVGHGVEDVAADAIRHGAERVWMLDLPVFRHYLNKPYTGGLFSLVRRHQPEVFLIGATTTGRDLAGSVATCLGTGLTADCTHLQIGEATGVPRKVLLMTRPAFGGNVIATIVCRNHLPQMATVRPRVFCAPAPKPDAKGEIIRETVDNPEGMVNAQILEFIANQAGKVKLEYADVIVSGGRGLGKPAGFDLIRELALSLGGVVGSSRACVDAGWISHEHQVGQTGKTVRPKLYIAAGISGAIQHKVGMQGSDFILAINRDPHAPIFEVATVGIVGDLYAVIPSLILQIRAFKEVRHA